MNTLVSILFANAVISLISFVGLISISFKFLRKHSTSTLLVSFAAGVLLATAILNILPEALEGLPEFTVMSWFMGSIIFAFLMERMMLWYHHHHEDTHDIDPTAALIIFGDAIHNFVDGLAIAAAFLVSGPLGLTATIAIAAHELPQELADYSILRHCGMSRRNALIWNFLSAITAIVGGVVGFYIFSTVSSLVHYALAISAGIFVYVAAADLIPELHHGKARSAWLNQTVLFLVGIGLMFVITQQTPHSHADGHTHTDEHLESCEHDEDECNEMHEDHPVHEDTTETVE